MSKPILPIVAFSSIVIIAAAAYLMVGTEAPSPEKRGAEIYHEDAASQPASRSTRATRTERPPFTGVLPKTVAPDYESKKLAVIAKQDTEAVAQMESGDLKAAAAVRDRQLREAARQGSLAGTNAYTVETAWLSLMGGDLHMAESRAKALAMMVDLNQMEDALLDDIAMFRAAYFLKTGKLEDARGALNSARAAINSEPSTGSWERSELTLLQGYAEEVAGQREEADRLVGSVVGLLSKATSTDERATKVRAAWIVSQIADLRGDDARVETWLKSLQ